MIRDPQSILWLNFAVGVVSGAGWYWYQQRNSSEPLKKSVLSLASKESESFRNGSASASTSSLYSNTENETSFQAALQSAVIDAASIKVDMGVENSCLPKENDVLLASSSKSHADNGQASVLSQVNDAFQLSTAKLHNLVRAFIAEYEKGLLAENHTLKMLPSFAKRPCGSETGTYIALDLGGTNLRVCEVQLEGNGQIRSSGQKFTVPESLKKGKGDDLFDFIADCVSQFINVRNLSKESKLHAGFSFSFSCRQTSLQDGYLLLWHKGYECDDVLNKNVVELVNEAFERKSVGVRVVALVNDAVATLLSSAYVNPECCIGVILGTGTNAAYVEDLDRIPKLKTHEHNASQTTPEIPYSPLRNVGVPPSPINPPTRTMVINTEWGAFDNRRVILPVTSYDYQLDRTSSSPGIQIFEKMVGGMFLGELCRLIFLDLVKAGELFNGIVPASLEVSCNFLTAYMSRIGRDHTDELMDTKLVLEGLLDIQKTTTLDRQIVKRVCALVGIRAARLAACAIAALVIKINKLSGCTVAVDGTLYEFYPHFRSHIRDALSELLGISADKISLVSSKDGSATGSAVAAAIAASLIPA